MQVVAWVSGTCATLFKSEVQFGHAGAKSGGALESAQVILSLPIVILSLFPIVLLFFPIGSLSFAIVVLSLLMVTRSLPLCQPQSIGSVRDHNPHREINVRLGCMIRFRDQ